MHGMSGACDWGQGNAVWRWSRAERSGVPSRHRPLLATEVGGAQSWVGDLLIAVPVAVGDLPSIHDFFCKLQYICMAAAAWPIIIHATHEQQSERSGRPEYVRTWMPPPPPTACDSSSPSPAALPKLGNKLLSACERRPPLLRASIATSNEYHTATAAALLVVLASRRCILVQCTRYLC